MSARRTTGQFKVEAILKHGERLYCYSAAEYKCKEDKLDIICSIHGLFSQRAGAHIRGQGCPKCFGREKSSTVKFIAKARSIHGDRYSYNDVNYVNDRVKVKILCSCHGSFEQSPTHHLQGKGCKKCSRQHTPTTEEFILRANDVHGNKYDYSMVEYKNAHSKINIKCKMHGYFNQSANSHIRGIGCPLCSGRKMKYAYLHAIENDNTAVAVKFGIASNPSRRLKEQARLSIFDLNSICNFKFISNKNCAMAELECKRTLETGVLTKREMPDGYTETTYAYNVEKIIEIYEKYGGVRE